MADKNKDESACDANPHDLRDHFEFARVIAVAMGNNCPTAKWHSWEDVPENVKKAVMDEVLMSHLIRTRRAMTFTPSLTTTPTTAATTPAEMDHRPINLVNQLVLRSQRRRHCRLLRWRCLLEPDVLTGNPALQTRCRHRDSQPMPWVRDQLLKWVSHGIETVVLWKRFDAKEMAKMFNWEMKTLVIIMKQITNGRIPIRYNERHWAAPTAEQHNALAHDIGHVMRTVCPMLWKSWKAMSEETKNTVRNQLSKNYNLEDMDEDIFVYLNQLFFKCYKKWKSDLHQCFQQFDDPQVALEEGCPKELEDQQDSWVWLCGHFQEPGYVNNAKVNKINWEKKTFLHHSGSRPFSYKMKTRWKEGSKFPEINIFADVYVRHEDELIESLHSVLQESASQLLLDTPIEYVDPIEDAGFHIVTETLDQTFDQRPGTYCRGIGNARRRESRASSSSSELASYKSQMSMLVQALSSSKIHLPCFSAPSPSHPFHTEQAQQSGPLTSDPVPNQ
ncbi:hypothetical protein D8674_014045 [Pyrus ussuriensis x Pyrus communis]|uniref:Uncharacterized protein n=1 Tax=Pyrus ussuriensis x Pyrus communis TaxID=2448454 RepID=A0A5N5GRE4_9ROSA|nr:hypothetical protein D8674_014045 [Pyrus ussuriensis x Pyrus communis]